MKETHEPHLIKFSNATVDKMKDKVTELIQFIYTVSEGIIKMDGIYEIQSRILTAARDVAVLEKTIDLTESYNAKVAADDSGYAYVKMSGPFNGVMELGNAISVQKKILGDIAAQTGQQEEFDKAMSVYDEIRHGYMSFIDEKLFF